MTVWKYEQKGMKAMKEWVRGGGGQEVRRCRGGDGMDWEGRETEASIINHTFFYWFFFPSLCLLTLRASFVLNSPPHSPLKHSLHIKDWNALLYELKLVSVETFVSI